MGRVDAYCSHRSHRCSIGLRSLSRLSSPVREPRASASCQHGRRPADCCPCRPRRSRGRRSARLVSIRCLCQVSHLSTASLEPQLTVESYAGPTEKSLKAPSSSRSSRNAARRTLNRWQPPTLSRRRARKRRSRSTSATSCKNRAMLSTPPCRPDPATTRPRRTTRSLGDPTSTADAPSATPATACTASTSAISATLIRSARLSNCCRKRRSTWSSAARSNCGRRAGTGHACR